MDQLMVACFWPFWLALLGQCLPCCFKLRESSRVWSGLVWYSQYQSGSKLTVQSTSTCTYSHLSWWDQDSLWPGLLSPQVLIFASPLSPLSTCRVPGRNLVPELLCFAVFRLQVAPYVFDCFNIPMLHYLMSRLCCMCHASLTASSSTIMLHDATLRRANDARVCR